MNQKFANHVVPRHVALMLFAKKEIVRARAAVYPDTLAIPILNVALNALIIMTVQRAKHA